MCPGCPRPDVLCYLRTSVRSHLEDTAFKVPSWKQKPDPHQDLVAPGFRTPKSQQLVINQCCLYIASHTVFCYVSKNRLIKQKK